MWAGYLDNDKVEVPEGLTASLVDVLLDDKGQCWVLAFPEPLVALDEESLVSVTETETVRAAKAKLTDKDLEALGLTRED